MKKYYGLALCAVLCLQSLISLGNESTESLLTESDAFFQENSFEKVIDCSAKGEQLAPIRWDLTFCFYGRCNPVFKTIQAISCLPDSILIEESETRGLNRQSWRYHFTRHDFDLMQGNPLRWELANHAKQGLYLGVISLEEILIEKRGESLKALKVEVFGSVCEQEGQLENCPQAFGHYIFTQKGYFFAQSLNHHIIMPDLRARFSGKRL